MVNAHVTLFGFFLQAEYSIVAFEDFHVPSVTSYWQQEHVKHPSFL